MALLQAGYSVLGDVFGILFFWGCFLPPCLPCLPRFTLSSCHNVWRPCDVAYVTIWLPREEEDER